ncbi:IclR family transcriptional regulator [Luedemannella helvata]|uniref:IclR family transcriptional regulator n=1 Tax=Luedemannella helvata TaxID=349315 RepID=A0ABP4WTR6_9ACTN
MPRRAAAEGDTSAAGEERGAQAIHRVLTLLEVFSTAGPSISLTELSEHAGLAVPTAHRMLRALQSRGYVTHDPISGHYSLGPSVMTLAQAVLVRGEQDRLLTLAMPHLEALRDQTNETTGLHVVLGNSRVCIAECVSPEVVRMALGVGRVLPLYAGAAGKALLSGMRDDALDAVLADGAPQRPGRPTTAEAARLRRALVVVREDGYATSDEEAAAGAAAIAAPVFGARGVEAAIAIAGPAARWSRTARTAAVPRLLATVATISEQLGHRPGGDNPRAARPRRGATSGTR